MSCFAWMSWWRHQMETFSAILDICAGNSPVNGEFPAHKGQWRGALMLSLIRTRINGWVNNRKGGDLNRNRAHYDVTVMIYCSLLRKIREFPLYISCLLESKSNMVVWSEIRGLIIIARLTRHFQIIRKINSMIIVRFDQCHEINTPSYFVPRKIKIPL